MKSQLRVKFWVIADVAMYIRRTLRRDSSQLNANAMPSLFKVPQAMPISTSPTVLISTTAQGTTDKTEPEVLPQLTFSTVL